MQRNKIYDWILAQKKPTGTVIGISGAQGIGKTTLCAGLVDDFKNAGISALSISIDDFYWPRLNQIQLGDQNPLNPYLQDRGYPGTHDLELGTRILKQLKTGPFPLKVPTYDKSAFHGKGDRTMPDEWKIQEKAPEIILFDGWMLGFHALKDDSSLDINFRVVNAFLKSYESLWSGLNRLVLLEPTDISNVVNWRVEAEEKMKASGRDGMSTAEIQRYIERFIPAYEIYLPGVREKADLIFKIQKDRTEAN